MKIVLFITIIELLVSCSILPKQHAADIEQNVGWLHGNCLAIKNSHVENLANLTVVNFEAEQKLLSATIIGRAKSGDECYALIEGRKNINTNDRYSFYKVESKIPVNLAIGFLKLKNPDELDFDYCSTTEGILFSIFKYKTKVWEGYYYLGYESEETCGKKSNK